MVYAKRSWFFYASLQSSPNLCSSPDDKKKQKPNNSCCQFSKEECSLEWRGTIVMAFDKPKRCGECPACRSGRKDIRCEVPETVRAQRERAAQRGYAKLAEPTKLESLFKALNVTEEIPPGIHKRQLVKPLHELAPWYRKQYTDQASFVGKLVFMHLYGDQWRDLLRAAAAQTEAEDTKEDSLRGKAEAVVKDIISEANRMSEVAPRGQRTKSASRVLRPLAGHFSFPDLVKWGYIQRDSNRKSLGEAKKRKITWRLGCSPDGKARMRQTRCNHAFIERQKQAIEVIKNHLSVPLADRPVVLFNQRGQPTIFGGRQRIMGRVESWRAYLRFFESNRANLPDLKPLSRSQFFKVWADEMNGICPAPKPLCVGAPFTLNGDCKCTLFRTKDDNIVTIK